MTNENFSIDSSALKVADLFEMLRKEWPLRRETMPGDGDWTLWVKSYFHDKGNELGFKSEHTKLPDGRCDGEYIVDLCWWPEEAEQYWLELVLESEWSPDWKNEIDQDFYKLIDLKARLKVWVCAWGEKQMEKARKYLCRCVSQARFKQQEEQYLIVNMPYSKERNHEKCIAVEGFWMDRFGNPSELEPFQIHRHT